MVVGVVVVLAEQRFGPRVVFEDEFGREAPGMRQQLMNRHVIPVSRPRVSEMGVDRVGDVRLLEFDQLEHGDGGERLRKRGDRSWRLVVERPTFADMGEPISLQIDDLVFIDDADDAARNVLVVDLGSDQGVERLPRCRLRRNADGLAQFVVHVPALVLSLDARHAGGSKHAQRGDQADRAVHRVSLLR